MYAVFNMRLITILATLVLTLGVEMYKTIFIHIFQNMQKLCCKIYFLFGNVPYHMYENSI